MGQLVNASKKAISYLALEALLLQEDAMKSRKNKHEDVEQAMTLLQNF